MTSLRPRIPLSSRPTRVSRLGFGLCAGAWLALASQAALAQGRLDAQYEATLSRLQDLDYSKALSDFARQQLALEASQKSFLQVSGLSLFNYL